jgi:pterin-4a-carbinolamine dehydratase
MLTGGRCRCLLVVQAIQRKRRRDYPIQHLQCLLSAHYCNGRRLRLAASGALGGGASPRDYATSTSAGNAETGADSGRTAKVVAREGAAGNQMARAAAADPTARRPNRVCDPYGQGGRPLESMVQIQSLRATLHADWNLVWCSNGTGTEDDAGQVQPADAASSSAAAAPVAIVRECVHPDFLAGARFLHGIAAVAQVNAHYPSIALERRIVGKQSKKNWVTVSIIRCQTTVLRGLSTHDFHLAMVRQQIRFAFVIDVLLVLFRVSISRHGWGELLLFASDYGRKLTVFTFPSLSLALWF